MGFLKRLLVGLGIIFLTISVVGCGSGSNNCCGANTESAEVKEGERLTVVDGKVQLTDEISLSLAINSQVPTKSTRGVPVDSEFDEGISEGMAKYMLSKYLLDNMDSEVYAQFRDTDGVYVPSVDLKYGQIYGLHLVTYHDGEWALETDSTVILNANTQVVLHLDEDFGEENITVENPAENIIRITQGNIESDIFDIEWGVTNGVLYPEPQHGILREVVTIYTENDGEYGLKASYLNLLKMHRDGIAIPVYRKSYDLNTTITPAYEVADLIDGLEIFVPDIENYQEVILMAVIDREGFISNYFSNYDSMTLLVNGMEIKESYIRLSVGDEIYLSIDTNLTQKVGEDRIWFKFYPTIVDAPTDVSSGESERFNRGQKMVREIYNNQDVTISMVNEILDLAIYSRSIMGFGDGFFMRTTSLYSDYAIETFDILGMTTVEEIIKFFQVEYVEYERLSATNIELDGLSITSNQTVAVNVINLITEFDSVIERIVVDFAGTAGSEMIKNLSVSVDGLALTTTMTEIGANKYQISVAGFETVAGVGAEINLVLETGEIVGSKLDGAFTISTILTDGAVEFMKITGATHGFSEGGK